MLQLVQCAYLDLADPLTSHFEFLAQFFEGVGLVPLDPESHLDHLAFTQAQRFEHCFDPLFQGCHRDAVSRWRLASVLEEKSEQVEAGARELLAAALDEAGISRLGPWPAMVQRSVERLREGELDGLLADDRRAAEAASRRGASLADLVAAIRCFDRSWLRLALEVQPEAERPAALEALGALSDRRLAALVGDFEDDSGKRLLEEQEALAAAREECRRLALGNDALRRAESRSEHRAEQIALVNAVAHRIAPILDPDGLLQATADEIQARAGHTYVGVVILDHEGVLVGRWAGRQGVLRRSAGRAQGPAGGVIGRAISRRAPQVVADVDRDPDYYRDVPSTRSEMVVPLIEDGHVIGAMDFQSERGDAFDLDAVAAGEALAEFLVVALRNARQIHVGRAGD